MLQTYFPDHYAGSTRPNTILWASTTRNCGSAIGCTIRLTARWPTLLIRSDKLDEALRWSGILGKWFEKTRHEGIRVLGPAAAPILRLKQDYRYHLC